jgi:DNA-binding PadR family transcriptional regulator
MRNIDTPWGGFGRPPFGPDAECEPPHGRRLRAHRRGHRRGGPHFGPGFLPPARGFGRGRRSARGDIRLAVLALLGEQPRHGYEIIQEIAERTGGAWRPSPGSVYPTLAQLQDEGLVTVEKSAGRRIVELTEAGTAYVAEHRAELDAVWQSAAGDDDEDAEALMDQLRALHAAAAQVLGAGTPEQIQTATAAITEARRAVYRLLAE